MLRVLAVVCGSFRSTRIWRLGSDLSSGKNGPRCQDRGPFCFCIQQAVSCSFLWNELRAVWAARKTYEEASEYESDSSDTIACKRVVADREPSLVRATRCLHSRLWVACLLPARRQTSLRHDGALSGTGAATVYECCPSYQGSLRLLETEETSGFCCTARWGKTSHVT
jgi:hypothetical protein